MTQPQPREDWDRLRRLLAAQIDHLGLQQSDIQAGGGPSPAKTREILNGRSRILSNSLRRGLERAVQWPPGTFETILNGGDPPQPSADFPLHQRPAEELLDSMDELVRELRRRVSDDPEGWAAGWVPSQQ